MRKRDVKLLSRVLRRINGCIGQTCDARRRDYRFARRVVCDLRSRLTYERSMYERRVF